MTTTHPVDTPTYVRIRDLDPERRVTHAADAIVCRADRLADALLRSGWFAVLPDLIAPELQRALLSGACTDGMERTLDIQIEKLSGGDATLPSMTTTAQPPDLFTLVSDAQVAKALIEAADLADQWASRQLRLVHGGA